MHNSGTRANGRETQSQSSACGPYLIPAIQVALNHLEELKGARDQEWDITDRENARIWEALLIQSQEYAVHGVAPHRLRNDIGTPAGVKLTQRRWEQCRRWLKREVKTDLALRLEAHHLPMLHEARISNPRGGRHEISEAEYYLSYQKGGAIPKQTKKNKTQETKTPPKTENLDSGDTLQSSSDVKKAFSPSNRFAERVTLKWRPDLNRTPLLPLTLGVVAVTLGALISIMVSQHPESSQAYWVVDSIAAFFTEFTELVQAINELFNGDIQIHRP